MIDHIILESREFNSSVLFYKNVLKPLDFEIVMNFEDTGCGFGINKKPEFFVHKTDKQPTPIHIAFRCHDRKAVDAFYQAAILSGGKDNGQPGIRADYHPNYYGAFVIDPNGNNIEAVCHDSK